MFTGDFRGRESIISVGAPITPREIEQFVVNYITWRRK